MEHGKVDSAEGHAAIGWLVMEDLITVLVVVILPPLAGGGGEGTLWHSLGIAMVKLAVLTAIMLMAGARFVPWLLLRVARLRSEETFHVGGARDGDLRRHRVVCDIWRVHGARRISRAAWSWANRR
jgi:predicted Kef-type K+ transport protein